MIRNTNYPLSEMSFDSAIRGPFDLIFDTFISAYDNRRRSEPSVSFSLHKTCKPLSNGSDRNPEAFLRIRDVSSIRRLPTTREVRIEQVLIP